MDPFPTLSSDIPTLSLYIIFQTLSRVSTLKTLDAGSMVCKDRDQWVHEPNFQPIYCNNTKNLYGYYIQRQRLDKYKKKFISLESGDEFDHTKINKIGEKLLEDGAKIEASSNKAFCCVVRWKPRSSYRYYICKPSTGQWQPLPNPKLRFWTVKVALVILHPNPLRFKIVRVSQNYGLKSIKPLDCYAYCCEIFDSEVWAWRRVDDIILPYEVFFNNHRNQSVYAGGLIHWLTTDDQVVAFDHEGNNYVRFALPPLKNNSFHQLIEYEGKLGLVCKSAGENIELWTVDDRKSHEWNLVKEIKLDSSLEEEYAVPEGFYNRNIAEILHC